MVFPIVKRTIIPLVRLYIDKVKGIENLPKDIGFIIAANHTSYMDHLIISAIILPDLDRKVHFLAKKEHFESLHQRLWHKYVGAIPLDRQKKGKGALRIAASYLRKGKIIGIYPEGTRSLNGKLQRAKTGIARLALTARVPVLPVGIIGSYDILPKGKLIPKSKKANIKIGELMYFEKYYTKRDNKKVLRLVTTKIMKEIARLSDQRYDFK